ncbi:MAG: hypothetical protein HY964_04870 [Ignavibacteriales bacterium]|nr:hypothetical protein [Ignavibacteriales bacterium]
MFNQNSTYNILRQFKQAKLFYVTKGGIIYVYDKSGQSLIKLSSSGDSLLSIGGFGWNKNSFEEPSDLYSPDDLSLYLADYSNSRIIQYDRNLSVEVEWQLNSSEPYAGKLFRHPKSISLDNFGKLYVIDDDNKKIVKINRSQKLEKSFGGFDAGKGRLTDPKKIRISDSSEIFVQDGNNIIVYDLFGNYIRKIYDGLFKKLKTFCLAGNNLITVDSLGISKINNRGVMQATADIKSFDDRFNFQTIQDVNYQNNRLFILTEKYLFTIKDSELFE